MLYDYALLKDKEFPPSLFVHPYFVADGTLDPFYPTSVAQVHLSFMSGGLLLWVYLHHTIAEGDVLQSFLEAFSAATRGEDGKHDKTVHVDFLSEGLPTNAKGDSSAQSGSGDSSPVSFEALISEGLEHTVAPAFTSELSPIEEDDPVVGTSTAHAEFERGDRPVRGPVRQGNMFVFQEDVLLQLRAGITYLYLQAKGVHAELPAEAGLGEIVDEPDNKSVGETTDNSDKKPAGETADNHEDKPTEEPSVKTVKFSCYEALAALIWAHATRARTNTEQEDTKLPALGDGPARLLVYLDQQPRDHPTAAAGGRSSAWIHPDVDRRLVPAQSADVIRACEKLQHLMPLVEAIRASIDARGASSKAPIPPLDMDGYKPHHLVMNTWRSIGMGTTWNIPGVQASAPAAIRAPRGNNALGYAHVLPKSVDSAVVEVAIYLPEKAMFELMKDEDFMIWVDHVVY